MSTYVGPFGRMLPVADGPPPERDPKRPANLPVPASHPYQLPPPRVSAPLQFGTDPFLHQRSQGERGDPGGSISSHAKPGQQPQSSEHLPPVSQLLTPTAQSPRSLTPYRSNSSGFYAPPNDFEGSPRQLPPRESGPINNMPRGGLHGNSPYSMESTRLPPGNLPPLAHLSTPSVRRDSYVQPRNYIESPTPQIPPSHALSTYDVSYHDRETAETPSMETADQGWFMNKSKVPNVRPHVVDERHIEGEGLCYIYADGTHCPKLIDGIPVNANWGITKAGKPRKRLAQACLTCREKKIKCQPNLPKCDQCQKSGRECRFESAPRGHRSAFKASEMGRYDARELSSGSNSLGASNLYSLVRASGSSTSLAGTNSQSPVSEASIITPSAVDSNQESLADHERRYGMRALSTSSMSATADDLPKRGPERANSRLSSDYTEILTELKDLDPQDPQASDWRRDPYATDPELTLHYVECYFTYVNDRLYYMFPRRRFLLWLRSCQTKTLNDNMLLYSMMALGSVFSDRPDRVMALKRYSRTARYAVEHSRHSLSLQLAQSRLIMSLWYYAIGALMKSWDAIGAAVRTVCGLRYNVESGGVIVDQAQGCEYGLHPQALMECRRRTFWAAFLMDRLSCFYTRSSTFIPSQTAYLRLPCREEVYEAQQYTSVPYFQNFLNQMPASPEDELSGISVMALLIDIMSIWGDVSDHVFRLSLMPTEAYTRFFEDFYSSIIRRTNEWTARLPDHLAFNGVNMERSIRAKKADTFMTLHLLYHATLMKLNRHARYQYHHPGVVERYVQHARHHAVEILRISLSVVHYAFECESARVATEPASPKGTIMNPFAGYIILSAIDVLSAGGLMVDLPDILNLIRAGHEAVRELSRIWGSSIVLLTLIERRLDAIAMCLHHPREMDGKLAFLLHGVSLDAQVRTGAQRHDPNISEDLLYGGLPREHLLGALGVGEVLFSAAKVLWIREGS